MMGMVMGAVTVTVLVLVMSEIFLNIYSMPDHDGYGYGSGYGGGGDNGGVTMEPGDLEAAGKSKKYFSFNMMSSKMD